jgi:ribosome-associated toxin RatA of RatAB toxin-antitoxin module
VAAPSSIRSTSRAPRAPRAPTILLVAVIAVIAAAFAPATADAYRLRIERCSARGDSVEIRANSEIAASPEVVWRVITDYERMSRFVPGVYRARRLRATPEGPLVELVGVGRVMWVNRYVLAILQTRENAPRAVSFRAVGGDFRFLRGAWTIEPMPGGRSRLRCRVEARPKWAIPDLLLAWAARGEFVQRMQALSREAERRAKRG